MGIRTRFAGLGDAYKAFADRQIKPLLRGMDADRASAEEIEGLAWGGNNLRGGNVRNSENQQFPDDFSPEQTRLHRETIPAGGWETQAPVSNEQPNILGRLLVSDRDDEVANRLLNDVAFTKALGTTPAELQAVRNRINDAVELGAGIQGRNLDELTEQGITSVSEAGNLLRLRDEVRANPNNQSVSRLLDEVRNPRIKQVKANPVFDDGDWDAPPTPLRAGLVEQKQPQTFGEYQALKQKQEGRMRNALRKDGQSTEQIDAFIRDNPNPDLPDLDEATFNQIKLELGDSPFNLGMEIEKGVERQLPDRGEADKLEDVFLADFLTKKLSVSPDTLELASASGSPAVKQRAHELQAQRQLFDEIGFGDGGADRMKADIWDDDGKALGQMRDAVISAEDIGSRATGILKADEPSRQRTVLERMKGGEKVRIRDPWTGQLDSGMNDPDVAKFVRELEAIQGSTRNPDELRSLIDVKVAELNASRPDIVEVGLRHLDSQQLKQGKSKGGGRKTASKVLGKADRAGMDVPLLSKEAQQTYRQFVNPNNPMNLGTPVIAVGAGTLATTGALLVDAMKEEEMDNYASSMAKQQAKDTLRKADPEVLAMAIENAGWY